MGGTMSSLPVWAIPAIIVACFSVCASCVGIGVYFGRFVTHPICKTRMDENQKGHDEDVATLEKAQRDEKEQRRKVWDQVSETREMVVVIHSSMVSNGLIGG